MLSSLVTHRAAPLSHDIGVLGMSLEGERMELHGLGEDGEVLLQGWFPLETGVAMILAMDRCHVALDASSISDEFVLSLQSMGFATSVVPATRHRRRVVRRSAAALARHVADESGCNSLVPFDGSNPIAAPALLA